MTASLTRDLAVYGLPMFWILCSVVALRFALPVVLRLRRIVLYARIPKEDGTAEERELAVRLALIDYRGRSAAALVPVAFIVIGVVAMLMPPLIITRLVSTVALFFANFAITYKFYSEDGSYRDAEGKLLKRGVRT